MTVTFNFSNRCKYDCNIIFKFITNIIDHDKINYDYLSTKLVGKELEKVEYILRIDDRFKFEYEGREYCIINTSPNQDEELGSDGFYWKNVCYSIECANKDDFEILMKAANKFKSETPDKDELVWIYRWDYGAWDLCHSIKKRHMNSIFLHDDVKNSILNDLKNFYDPKYIDKYKEIGIPHTRTYLFYGMPGTGKTSMVKALASSFDMKIANLSYDKNCDDDMLKLCLKQLPKKSILLIEDIDCLFNSRDSKNDKNWITFSGLLNALDGVVQNDEIVIILTTNHIEKLDVALKRRVDLYVEFKDASRTQMQECFNLYYPQYEHKFDCFYDKISKNKKITMNILIKYFNKHIFDDVSMLDDFDDFIKYFNIQNENTSVLYI